MVVRPRAVAFDVIGTTFSLEPVRTVLKSLGFPAHVLETWFARTLRDAFALAATETFAHFRELFESNLDELARSYSLSLNKEQKEKALGEFASLPAHPGARQAFEHLKVAGIRIYALSNGAAASSQKLFEKAGLIDFVERVISVEDIRTFKPRREIYLHAARLADAAPNELALVATHAWDVHGAKCAGLLAGFVGRGQTFPSYMQTPDVLGDSLLDVARAFAG